ncbi:MAG: protein kinase [Planctomycetota bacterium]|nr:protein kinase [Planctomycetota bacterium]
MTSPFSKFETQTTNSQSKAILLVFGVGTVVLFLLLTFLVGLPVRNSLREQACHSLQATLRGDVIQLESWIESRKSDVRRFTTRHLASIREIPEEMADGAGPLIPDDLDPRYLGWVLLDSDRRTVQSSLPKLQGQQLPIVGSIWKRLPERAPFVVWPFRVPLSTTESSQNEVLMGVVEPLVEGGKPLGGVMLLLDPIAEFEACFSGSNLGETAESIAFGPAAQLIYSSSYKQDHQGRDTLPAAGQEMLGVPLRKRNGTLTTIADQATRGGSGIAQDAVDDYRGKSVLAAWQWLPKHQLGLAVKIESAEVMSAWKRLCWAWSAFVILLVTAVAGGYRWLGREKSVCNHGTGIRQLGQYELRQMVGQGGMGAVYRGTHRLLQRDVAIKVLEATQLSEKAASRFEREVQMTARLCHPNTIDIYDYGRTEEGTFFYVMEFIDGITLQELVDQFGAQPPGRVIHLMLQICGSLAEAHQQGMVHRDIKPSNILLTARAGLYDMIKVLDFGLVKNIHETAMELTLSDGITGTPMYMSPESVRDAAMADQRSDLYSVGAVGYTLLTGQPTFDSDSSVDVCLKQLTEMPLKPEDRLGKPLPTDLQNVLMSCLRKDPNERPRSIEDLQSALLHCKADDWVRGDALQWWEIEFVAQRNHLNADPKHGPNLTGKPQIKSTTK